MAPSITCWDDLFKMIRNVSLNITRNAAERVIRIGILWRWLIYGALSQKCAYNSCWLLPYGLFTRCPIKFAPLSAAKGLRKIALITHVIEIFHFPRPQHYLHSNKVLCPHHKKPWRWDTFDFQRFWIIVGTLEKKKLLMMKEHAKVQPWIAIRTHLFSFRSKVVSHRFLTWI